MHGLLFADAEPGGLLPFLRENWLLILPIVLGFGAIYALLPKARRSRPFWGIVVSAIALLLGGVFVLRMHVGPVETLLFYAFAGLAIVSGGMMITQKNPVHAALSFALSVLSTCGLFLLQAAPFLMAATMIVYAGAIVVIFLFVIMLAQQEGPSSADQRSREPFLATLAGCILLVSLVCILHKTHDTTKLDDIVYQLEALSEVRDKEGLRQILGDPGAETRTPLLIMQLRDQFGKNPDEMPTEVDDLHRMWNLQKVDEVNKHARNVLVFMSAKRNAQASLSLYNVPGKTPAHREPGRLPANNVAAVGKTLFTDYLVAVEFAAALLLVATIGAIVIAGRKTEVPR
jgi:NADH:ubiquinone oxidoreductase subunit 6 (subunit J)